MERLKESATQPLQLKQAGPRLLLRKRAHSSQRGRDRHSPSLCEKNRTLIEHLSIDHRPAFRRASYRSIFDLMNTPARHQHATTLRAH